MTKSFNYRFNDGRTLRLELNMVNNGVVTNTYMPDYLSPGYGNPMFGSGMNIQDPEEFNQDCFNIIDCFNTISNRLDYRKLDDWFQVLAAVVRDHISNYNRIFISDVKTYVDDITLLMKAVGCDDALLRECYGKFTLWIVENYKEHVKDGIPGIGIIQFTSTNAYRTLLEKCSK